MLSWVVAILLQTRFAAPDAALATAALASPRPRACRPGAAGEEGLWSRLRVADAQRYCQLLARGYARLQETPAEALSAAEAAEAAAGPQPAVHVLRGRALMRLDQSGPAFEQFAQAEAQDPEAFVDPKALHEYARAASLSGKAVDALRLYRLLVSRIALLDDAREAAFVQIEAAAHVLAASPGPAGTDEALGYLAQARREALGLSVWLDGLRLLALAQSGRAESNAALAPSLAALGAALGAPGAASRAPTNNLPLLPPGMLEAIRAAFTAAPPRKARAR
jgi:hypothetical protein